ncbi:hypothetical protein PsorP6_005339 [Peronosclerospora sorghi]|uniref:Uncharacterized protein n=1 Tax=Peronosclerospora sorghi TaxID=230839 RepID=A0ACC0W2R8_9STRA|nr:hypothetical protein PsorP6_005339 [Peronosclerospora sorghi]
MKVRDGRFFQLRHAIVLVLATCAFVSANTAPSLYDYKYDGTTTYCYWMDQGMQVSNVDFAYVLEDGVGPSCPLTVSLEQDTPNPIVAGTEVEYLFTATLNLIDNAFNLTQLQAVVPDPTTGLPMQIGHANVHACARSTVCDIFRPGSNRKIAEQETSNFTSAGTATFRQKLTYPSAGKRNVFAHIILPPTDYLNQSYHFITFMTTNVEASTKSAANSASSGGLSTGAGIAIILAAVVVLLGVIVSVVFYRRKRGPGHDMDPFQSGGFGLPGSYAATKSKTHLNWNAEPEPPSTSSGSGWKNIYSGESQLQESRGPGLNASALVFHDPQTKTVSSSGSLPSSNHGPGDSDVMYNNYMTPMQRSGQNLHHSARDAFGASQSNYPDDSMYEGDSRLVEEDPNLEYGRTPDLETFGIGANPGPSFESETSIDSAYTEDSHFTTPHVNAYRRGSDLSSMGESEDLNESTHHRRGNGTIGSDSRKGSENRSSSVSSIGTVDFTQDEPAVRFEKPLRFEPLDESLTMSAIAKARVVNLDLAQSNGFANSNSSDSTEFIVHDSSTDFASTTSSVNIDGRMNFDRTINSVSEYASSDIVSTADIVSDHGGTSQFGASTTTDIVASSDFSASSTGDFTKQSFHRDYDDVSSMSSDMDRSSYGSSRSSASYGHDGSRASYDSGLSYGNSIVVNGPQAGVSNTQSVYEFQEPSYAPTASDGQTGESLRPRRVSSATGPSYEF